MERVVDFVDIGAICISQYGKRKVLLCNLKKKMLVLEIKGDNSYRSIF